MKTCLRLSSILMLAFLCCGFTRSSDGTVSGRRAINALMDSAEFTMDDNPEYADSLMNRIDSHSIKSKSQRARYALLYTATQYKCYKPFTSDSLIMEAVVYYSVRNNIDYRFLSYYYLGCVYTELGRFKEAALPLSNAEWLVDRIDNDYWKGLLYTQLGVIFKNGLEYKRAEEYSCKAVDCYTRAGKELHKLYALIDCGHNLIAMRDYAAADSILKEVEEGALSIGDSSLLRQSTNGRFSCCLFQDDMDKAKEMLNSVVMLNEKTSDSFYYLELMAGYYILAKDYSESELYLKRIQECNLSNNDSIYYYLRLYQLAKNKGESEAASLYLSKYTLLDKQYVLETLIEPLWEVQYDYFRTKTELESVKARNRITILVASVMVFLLLLLIILINNRNRKRETEIKINDYISTINDLTTQITVNQDKISKLNGKVREMLRLQFNHSDYLYTRYYEQIDDSKKAERFYRVVKTQLEGFTTPKNIVRIDELLDETFDGIMTKLTMSGLDIKDKDLLLLRFSLAGFSAKSIAALLDDTHLNINQRKKRMLDKIKAKTPQLAYELHIALNDR